MSHNMEDNKSPIYLQTMHQLSEAVDMDDVWTGKKDPAARRKRQNRLAQRAYRKRHGLDHPQGSSSDAINTSHFPGDCVSWGQLASISGSTTASLRKPKIPPLIPYNIPPEPTFVFPLPPDHLITLVQYNVLRAIITNMSIMSLFNRLPPECQGILAVDPMIITVPQPGLPACLQPTPTQQSVPHGFWIDIFPCGTMRDNVIKACHDSSFDADQLCVDVVGGLFEGFNDIELTGVVVWSDPWHPTGWEITEGFAQKYGFLLKGCRELMQATNRWRALRNEDDLVWEL